MTNNISPISVEPTGDTNCYSTNVLWEKRWRNTTGLLPWGGAVMTPSMKLDNTNRYFSANEQSEDKVSMLGYGIGKDAEDNDLLYIYVIDHTTKGFMPEFFYWYFYPDNEAYAEWSDYKYYFSPTKPTATGMTDIFLIASFKKVVAE